MKIVGCEFHPGWQQVAVLEPGSGESLEWKLIRGGLEAERSYLELETQT